MTTDTAAYKTVLIPINHSYVMLAFFARLIYNIQFMIYSVFVTTFTWIQNVIKQVFDDSTFSSLRKIDFFYPSSNPPIIINNFTNFNVHFLLYSCWKLLEPKVLKKKIIDVINKVTFYQYSKTETGKYVNLDIFSFSMSLLNAIVALLM